MQCVCVCVMTQQASFFFLGRMEWLEDPCVCQNLSIVGIDNGEDCTSSQGEVGLLVIPDGQKFLPQVCRFTLDELLERG